MKYKITKKDLNDDFLYTLYRSRKDLLLEDDDEIEYSLFEEFQGSLTFIYEDVLNELLNSGFINDKIFSLSLELRDKAEHVLHKDDGKRLAKYVRIDPEWLDLFKLSDKIKALKNEFDNKRIS